MQFEPRRLAALTIIFFLVNCGGGTNNNSDADPIGNDTNTPSPTSSPQSTEPPSATPTPEPNNTSEPTPNPNRESNVTCIAPESETDSTSYSFELAYPELDTISGLIAMTQPLNDSSIWFAIERSGRVVSFLSDESATEVNEVLNISNKVSTSVEMGLTGIAVHPNYPSDNRIFILYNDASNDKRSTLSELVINTNTRTSQTETVLLTLDQPADNHNGGGLHFGGDGMLYAAFGDGGFDMNTSQDLTNLHGTLIRIDISDAGAYIAPTDNPFNSGQSLCTSGESSTNCPEIFAYGFRNPWRWSVDQATGQIWIGDVGEGDWEEIDRIVAGGNYGWPVMEGPVCFSNNNCDPDDYQLPVTYYDHDVGPSIVGGYVYRGTALPELNGQLVFADTFSRPVFSISVNANEGSQPNQLFTRDGIFLGSFAQDNQGEIFALDLGADTQGDAILRLTGDGQQVSMAENLSDTGCFNTLEKTPTSGVIDYDVMSALWSDGADKTRFFAIPDETRIEIDNDGDFLFPEGSILVKNFLSEGTFVETRLLVNHDIGWRGYSYEWNDAQTEATLVDEARTSTIGSYEHSFPNSGQCFVCHTESANISLGAESLQLNQPQLPISENQLAGLAELGYFSNNPNIEDSPRLYSIDDSSATTEQRARSYLHSNCSGCHRPNSSAAFMDLRFNTVISQTNTCNVATTNGRLGLNNPLRIDPGNASNSMIIIRMESLTSERMPPLASLIVDTTAVDIIREWINAMDNSCD